MELKIELPDSSFSALRVTPEAFADSLKKAAVAKWYELARISQSKGAEMLGVSRLEFLKILSDHQVSILQLDEESLKKELS